MTPRRAQRTSAAVRGASQGTCASRRRVLAGLGGTLALGVAAGTGPAGTALAQAARSGAAADARVLRVAFPIAETGFDPQAAGDIYSNHVNRAIFEPLVQYDYLARPYTIVPCTAVALPEISAGRKTYTFRVKPGIHFADDPVFQGKRRELTAQDYVYAIKRILDPAMRSNSYNVVEGRFVGADVVVAQAKETGRFDYDAPIEGIAAPDRYTLRLALNFPDAELLANLTTTALCAVAREVIEAHRDASGWVMAHPVGTGPYRLTDWRRGQRIVLEANPGYREVRYAEPADPEDRKLAAKLVGRRLPLVPRVEIGVIEESNPRMLAFAQHDLDYLAVPSDMVSRVLDERDRLRPDYAKQGVHLARGVMPAIGYLYFNMEDPVVGGYTPERIALRRAIGMGFDVAEQIRVIQQGQGMPSTQIVPPGMSGHVPGFAQRSPYDPASARALLDKFGYRDRDGDGFRELPDGKPLTLQMYSTPAVIDREQDELWQRNMRAIGVRAGFGKQKWPELLKSARLGQLQTWRVGNINTTPEGFGFLGLLYGPNSGFANLGRFRLAEYDRLYEEARALPPGAERNRRITRMNELFLAYAPWVPIAFRYENVLVEPWVLGYKYNGTWQHPWAYLDVDAAQRAKSRGNA
jgi:ABC-type transport system substrate-binding protein